MEIKKVYCIGTINAQVGFRANIKTAFGELRTSDVQSVAVTNKGTGLLVTKNSIYEISLLPDKKVRLAEQVQALEVGKPAIVFCNGNLFRTSIVISTMEDEYGFYVETQNTVYAARKKAV